MSTTTLPRNSSLGNLSWRNFRLGTKLVLTFLLVALVPLVIITFINTRNSLQTLTNDANQRLFLSAQLTAAQLDTFIADSLDTVRSEGQFPAIVDYMLLPAAERPGSFEEQRMLRVLTAITRRDPVFISSVAILDANGITVADTIPSAVNTDRSDRLYFRKVLETNLPFASSVEYDPITRKPSLYFAAPIRNSEGSIVGVLRVRYDASILQRVIRENTDTESNSFAVLLEEHYVRLAHGTNRDLIHKSIVPLDSALVESLQADLLLPSGTSEELATNLPAFKSGLDNLSTTPFFAADLQGTGGSLEQVAVVRTATQNWYVAFAQDQTAFLAPIQEQTRNNIVVALLIALGVAVFGYLMSQTLSRPIARLTQVATSISAGDINIQAKVESGDEIGTLAATFNRMTAQLREFIQSLEQRVADRTKALATSTEVSRRLSTILDQKELVKEVVNQVNTAFGYYHTQIYFFDANNEHLVMAGGTGESGQKMLEQFHKVTKGRGLVGRAGESNKPILVSDTKQNPEWLPNPLLPDTKSEVAIPISIGDQVLGVLDVQHNVANALQQEDVDSLQSIANQIAVALQNIRQYENTRKIASDMGVVATVGIATSTITETGRLLQEVVDLSKKSFGLYHAHIYLMNEAGDTLELTSGAGEVGRQMVSEKRNIPLDSEQSLVARAARTGEGVVVNDVTLSPDFLPNPLLPDTRAEMAVPMMAAGKVIGVLDVQSETVGRFTQVDVSIKTTLASQVAVALQNARSFAQSRRQAERETAVNTITQKIQSATNVESALQIAAREIGLVLGKRQTLVSLDLASLNDATKVAANE